MSDSHQAGEASRSPAHAEIPLDDTKSLSSVLKRRHRIGGNPPIQFDLQIPLAACVIEIHDVMVRRPDRPQTHVTGAMQRELQPAKATSARQRHLAQRKLVGEQAFLPAQRLMHERSQIRETTNILMATRNRTLGHWVTAKVSDERQASRRSSLGPPWPGRPVERSSSKPASLRGSNLAPDNRYSRTT